MQRWNTDIRHRRILRTAWSGSIGAIVLLSGCRTTNDGPGPVPVTAPSVSAYARTPGSGSAGANPTKDGIMSTNILPTQTVEAASYREPIVSTGQTKSDVDANFAQNVVGVSKSIGTSPTADTSKTLNLEEALRMAGVDNPTVNIAREAIREALAQQLNARVLMVPSLNIGGSYHHQDGTLQTASGKILSVTDQSVYTGLGAQAVGAGTVAYPGVWLSANLGDAVYEPLAARENVSARQSDSFAVQNRIMGEVVTAYLRLVGAEAKLAVLNRGDVEGAEVVRLTSDFAKAGQGLPSDANRARSFNDLVEQERRVAEEEVEVASAQLCRLLSVDPSNHFRIPGASLEPFRLIPEDTDLEILIARAMQDRPELQTRSAMMREAQVRVRQETIRPLLPIVSAGISSGGFGGDSSLVSQSFTQLAGRTDIYAMAFWNLENLGFGNRARVREKNALVTQAYAEYDSTKNLIRREVADALANALAASKQLEVARSAALNAEEGYRLDLQRIKGGQGVEGKSRARPIELLDSFNQILESRQELVAAITTFDIAQFRLFVAVGSNPLFGLDVSQAVPAATSNVPIRALPTPPDPKPIGKP